MAPYQAPPTLRRGLQRAHELPEAVRSRIGTTAAGRKFVQGFPGLVNDLADKWLLTLGPPFADLSHSWVAPARQSRASGGTRDVVPKLGPPGEQLGNQALALEAFRGRGCAQLLEADVERGALLLERVRPGRNLSTLDDDDRAMAIALEVAIKLWRTPPTPHGFRSVSG